MMKRLVLALIASSALTGTAHAADKPGYGPPPPWVKPLPLPAQPAKPDDAAFRILLSDQQISLERERQTIYTETAVKIQTPQGLAAGNLSFAWRPDTDTLTVHKLVIRRGDQVIDVLASGQTFTVLRREQNLESATLDGVLTATIQPEGLQVGDIIDFAASITSSDPVMKGHVEQSAAAWNGLPITRAHLRVQWPTTLPVRLSGLGGLPATKPVKAGGSSTVDFTLDDVQPIQPPKRAPLRYQQGRRLDMTDFGSWSELGALMAPLYDKAAVLPAKSPLLAEVDRIEKLSPDPKVRVEAALALVQDRVRYVALAMGAGGYVPADADLTWSRRYGDCKGKTALLLALLHALGVSAEPVAVNALSGDGLDTRLPMVGLFNHVLVRATIGGTPYWLDGTRSGDTSLDGLRTPNFGWGLPLVATQAALVRIMPAPLDRPSQETHLRIDATAGLTVPAPTKAEMIFRGDDAVATNAVLTTTSGEARTRALRDYWKGEYDFIDVISATATFDPKTREERLTMEGTAKMDWSSGWYETDGTRIGYKADFSRDPGPDRDAPFAVTFPYFTKTSETIVLPPGFTYEGEVKDAKVDQTVAGIEYHRRAEMKDRTFTIERSERSIAPEFAAKNAPTEQAALRTLGEKAIYIKRPAAYRETDAELKAAVAATPTTAAGFVYRGNILLDRGQFDAAIKDFDQALALDPKNAIALADRGVARVWKDDTDRAKADLDAAAAIDPRNPVVFRGRGLAAERKGDVKAALAAFTTALEIDPQSAFALQHRASLHRRDVNYEAALVDSAAALKIAPKATDMRLLRASIFRNQGKKDDALNEAVALEANAGDDAYAHVAAGNVYHALKHDPEAMRAYAAALAIKPEPYIYVNRSDARPRSDLAGRRSDIDAAMKLDPTDAVALTAKGRLQMETRDFTGAIATYSAAIAVEPDNINPRLQRGIAYASNGDAARAEQDFVAARKSTVAAGGFNNMCWSKALAGVALESALVDCNLALAKAPTEAGFLDSRGLVMLRLGRLDEALADYNKALTLRGTIASSLFGRGVVLARKGDKAKSDTDIAAALKIDPDVRDWFKESGVQP